MKMVATHRSDDNSRFAHVYEVVSPEGVQYHIIKLFENNEEITALTVFDRSFYYVNDMAENYCLDIGGYFWVK